MSILITIFLLCSLSLCSYASEDNQEDTRNYELLQTLDHNPTLFTQGLIYHSGFFYESSGHYARSRLVRYSEVQQNKHWFKQLFTANKDQRNLERTIFAEGLTRLGDTLYLLSWKSGRAFSFNAETLNPIDEFSYAGEGWGLTHNGIELIRSDGSDHLYFHSAEDFSVSRRLEVKGLGRSWRNINELEYVDGVIWANIWQENIIIAIDAKTGMVNYSVDLSKLVQQENPKKVDAVLNGIAYDTEREAFWVTGKYWQKLYLIRVYSDKGDQSAEKIR